MDERNPFKSQHLITPESCNGDGKKKMNSQVLKEGECHLPRSDHKASKLFLLRFPVK